MAVLFNNRAYLFEFNCNLVAEFFDGDPVKTALWFRTPNPMLGDMSPRDMIRYGRYKRLQKFILEAREEGDASAA